MSPPMAIIPAPNGAEEGCFPAPLASHEQVVNQPSVFWSTLKSFHSMLGSQFTIPTLGGKELDLHVLYVEVTKRGGFEKVVKQKGWRAVGFVFKFPLTITSASFLLKKHYSRILRDYELVYFFKKQGPLLSQTADSIGAASNGGNPPHEPEIAGLLEYPSKRSRVEPNPQATADYIGAAPNGGNPSHEPIRLSDEPNPEATVIGKIVGKFDCGYTIVVKVGSQVLHGVIYHPEKPSSSIPTIEPFNAPVPPKHPKLNRRSRRRGKRGGDPNWPKPSRSAYNFFFAVKHSEFKSLYPDREREFTKMIGEAWNKLNPEKRKVFQNFGLKDKERYNRELKKYKEKMNVGQSKEAVGASH